MRDDAPTPFLGGLQHSEAVGQLVLAEQVVGVEEGDEAARGLWDQLVAHPAEVALVHDPAVPVVEVGLVEVVRGRGSGA